MIGSGRGLLIAATSFAAPAIFGPQCAAWGIAVGALTLFILVRGMMAA